MTNGNVYAYMRDAVCKKNGNTNGNTNGNITNIIQTITCNSSYVNYKPACCNPNMENLSENQAMILKSQCEAEHNSIVEQLDIMKLNCGESKDAELNNWIGDRLEDLIYGLVVGLTSSWKSVGSFAVMMAIYDPRLYYKYITKGINKIGKIFDEDFKDVDPLGLTTAEKYEKFAKKTLSDLKNAGADEEAMSDEAIMKSFIEDAGLETGAVSELAIAANTFLGYAGAALAVLQIGGMVADHWNPAIWGQQLDQVFIDNYKKASDESFTKTLFQMENIYPVTTTAYNILIPQTTCSNFGYNGEKYCNYGVRENLCEWNGNTCQPQCNFKDQGNCYRDDMCTWYTPIGNGSAYCQTNSYTMDYMHKAFTSLLSTYGLDGVTNGQAIDALNQKLNKGSQIILEVSNDNTVVARKLSYIWVIIIVIILSIIAIYVLL